MISARKTKKRLKAARDLARAQHFNNWASYSLELWAKREGSIFLTAKESGRIVGFLLSRSVRPESEILVICVDDEFQNRGIGRALINELKKRSKKQGDEEIFLEVNEHNEPALHLYESLGFKKSGIREKYYNNNDNAYVMRLNLEDENTSN